MSIRHDDGLSTEAPVFQRLEHFKAPPGYPGRPPWVVQTWRLVEGSLFRLSPLRLFGWRRFLLRAFGARIGDGVLVRPTARVTHPWKVSIGESSWIGDDVVLYSIADIRIGRNSVVSQKAYLCAGTHDHEKPTFDLVASPINVGSQAWIAADVFIGPGVTVGDGAVIGARSTVFADVPPGTICHGQSADPAKGKPRHVDSGNSVE